MRLLMAVMVGVAEALGKQMAIQAALLKWVRVITVAQIAEH